MAGFFSLGSGTTGTGSGRDPPDPPPPANTVTTTTTTNNNNPNWAPNPTQPGGLLLYRNEEIYQKGFEIWQQYVQVHHHHPPPLLHHHHLYLGSGGGGDPYYPSPSSAGPSGGSGAGSRVMMRPGGGGGSGSGMNCQDCGNQAKKDCAHMRCRTCCKSRGFDCATHVKSTWVPAAKRRERHQQQLLALQQQQQQQQPPQHQLETGTTREKRLRESRDHPPPPPPQLGASTSGLEVGQHFPAELSSQAVFRCVRVHSVDDADEQLAYQTAINVRGHLFKGILYDQGPESHPPLAGAGDSSSGGEASGVGNIHPHNLLTAATSNDAALVDPNAIYPPPPISAFLAGTQFFPPPRS